MSKPNTKSKVVEKVPEKKGFPERVRPERPGLTEDEVKEIQEAFDLFDTQKSGKLVPRELKTAMQSLGFDTKNPTIYNLVNYLDTQENLEGIDFEKFKDAVADKLGKNTTEEETVDIYNLLVDEPKSGITEKSLTKVCKNLGINKSEKEIQEIIQRSASDSKAVTANDLYDIVTRDVVKN